MKRILLGAAFAAITAVSAPATAAHEASASALELTLDTASREIREVADWVIRTADHKGLPFAVVDKITARLYAFDRHGRFVRATPVLVGMGVGDAFPPGVAQMDMYQTKPWQRITPAGRFEAEVYEKGHGRSTVWVDYDSGIALHKMPTKKTSQHRAERMASAQAADHRITYGCINVPGAFYDAVVYPAFKAKGGIVYVLPEKMPLQAVFKSFSVGGARDLRQTEYAAR